MPTPTLKEIKDKKTKPASKTSPQIVNMFRRTMILDEMMALREKRYQEELAGWKSDIKNPPTGLNTHPPEDYLIKKHRQFYAHEMEVVAEHERNELRFNDILNKTPDFKAKFEESKSLPVEQRVKFLKESEDDLFNEVSPDIQEEYARLKQHLQVDVQEAVVASYFTPAYMKSSPDFAVAKANVQGMVRASVPAGMSGTKGEHTGVVNLFNQKYKGVKEQLKVLESKYPAQARAGKALLATGTLTLNPSGYLIGKGIGAIMQTKAFASFSKSVATHVSRVAEKTGLKDTLVAKLKSPQGQFYKKLAVGSVQAVAIGLSVVGFIEADKSFDIIANASDMVDGMINAGNEGVESVSNSMADTYAQASEMTSGVYDSANKFADDFLDGAAETITIENGRAIVDSAKDMASDAMNDLGQSLSVATPDMGMDVLPDSPEELSASLQKHGMFDFTDPSFLDSDAQSVDDVISNENNVAQIGLPSVDDVAESKIEAPEVKAQDIEPSEDMVPYPETPEFDDGIVGAENSIMVPETTYEVQAGDTPSEIAELKLKEAGIPYDYERIMKVVHMMADANEGMDNIHYIQTGWDLKIPEISLDKINEFTIPSPEITHELTSSHDLTLPAVLEMNPLSVSSVMELSEEIQSRLEAANMAYSAADIDALTQEVLAANNVPEGANLRGAQLDIQMIDDIVVIHGVEGQRPSIGDMAAITNDAESPELRKPFENDVKNVSYKR